MRHCNERARWSRVIWVPTMLAGLAVAVLAILAVQPRGEGHRTLTEHRTTPTVPAVRPTARARPKYLTRSYRAPPALVRSGAGGSLRIPSLSISAPVDAVGLDGTAMAVPDDPARLGWLSSSAGSGDVIGSSVLAGHVSDRHDRPGVLAQLQTIKIGASMIWTDSGGHAHRFRVIGLDRYPRSTGLPANVFGTDGPHLVRLVTCADREGTEGGGFHYRSNLVVTAGEVTRQR